MMKKILFAIMILLVAFFSFYVFKDQLLLLFFRPTGIGEEVGINSVNELINQESDNGSGSAVNGDTSKPAKPDVEVVASDLNIPWEVAFLPDGKILITERPGNLLSIGSDRQTTVIDGVVHTGEGGLLGLAPHPDFSNNQFIYLYLTTRVDDGVINRVERYRLLSDKLMDRRVIIDNIPGARYHDGGRIGFGPDGYLYITTGDASLPDRAQDLNSLAGKILRISDDGMIPPDNPFGSAVYSYGHRNPQGLAWDGQGRLWATEHGRSGLLSGLDELNLIEKGKNYGWPIIEGDETQVDMELPVRHSGASVTWAPAGAVYWDGSIFFVGLRGEGLYEAKINESGTPIKVHFRSEWGRLRAVALGPDGHLYITTSNRDGRGSVSSGDDKLIRINPEIFRR